MLKDSIEHPFVFVRLAFVLGNLTMLFGTSCNYVYTAPEAYEYIKDAMLCYVDIVIFFFSVLVEETRGREGPGIEGERSEKCRGLHEAVIECKMMG